MPPQNGSRSYLADEVRGQRAELTKLGKETAVNNANLALLLEAHGREETRAATHRESLTKQVEAMRAEQGQVQIAQAGVPGAIDRLTAAVESQSKKLADIEAERNQAKGAWNLASASARLAWGVVGGIVLAIAGFAAWIWRVASSLPPGTKLPPGGP